MREIKFRYWDIENKRMFYPEDISLNNINAEIDLNRPASDFHVMQFTGFKDAYGKEIYEGDIIEWFDKQEIAEIIWNKGAFVMKYILSTKRASDMPRISICAQTKVIGNMFEERKPKKYSDMTTEEKRSYHREAHRKCMEKKQSQQSL